MNFVEIVDNTNHKTGIIIISTDCNQKTMKIL